jgi:hypothetical protein
MSSPPIPTHALLARKNNLVQVSYPPKLTTLNIVAICLSTGVIVVTFLAALYIQQRKDKPVFIADNAHPIDSDTPQRSGYSEENAELANPDICRPGPRYADSLLTPTPEDSPRHDLDELDEYPTPSINVSPPSDSSSRDSDTRYAADNISTMSGFTYFDDMYHGNVDRKSTKKNVYKWLGRSEIEKEDVSRQDLREVGGLQSNSYNQNSGRRVFFDGGRLGPVWVNGRLNLGSEFEGSYAPSEFSNVRTATEDGWGGSGQ